MGNLTSRGDQHWPTLQRLENELRTHSNAHGGPSMFTGAQRTTITGGNFTAIGRDNVVNETVTNVVNNITVHNSQNERLHQRIVDWVSPINYRAIQIENYEKKTPGTVAWFINSDMFKDWFDSDGALLWGTGIPGAGKTVLASAVIHHLLELAGASHDICVAFAYCRYTEPIPVREILAGLVRQMLERYPFLLALIRPLYNKHTLEKTQPSQQELLTVLKDFSKMFKRCFFILDGLDEAPDDAKFDLVEALSSIKGNFIITSRPLSLLESMLPDAVFFDIVAHPDEVELFIVQRINRFPSLLSLIKSREGLLEEIISEIGLKAGGMFLHASLQVEALAQCLTVKRLREELRQFPTKIEGMYAATIERIQGQLGDHGALAQRILLWVVFARRPLSIEELRYAVATCPDTGLFDEDLVIPGNVLVSICCGLITLESTTDAYFSQPSSKLTWGRDNEKGAVRLIHYTAQDALRPTLQDVFPDPHGLLTKVCTARLVSSCFTESHLRTVKDLNNAFTEHCFLEYAYDYWAFHGQKCVTHPIASTPVRAHVVQFIQKCRSFPIFPKARPHEWTWEGDIAVNSPLDHLKPLHVLAQYNISQLLDPIISSEGEDPNVLTELGATAFDLALEEGHHEFLKCLGAAPEVDVNRQDESGYTILIRAVQKGDEIAVQRILEIQGVDINLCDRFGRTALMEASWNGHAAAVDALLDFPGIQVNLALKNGATALSLAAQCGHTPVVQRLLQFPGIEVNTVGNMGTPLMMASNEEVVESLLAFPGIQVNLGDRHGKTPLMKAVLGGQKEILRRLLQHPGIDVNARDREEKTMLMLAAWLGFAPIAEEILTYPGFNVNLVDNAGNTALILAATENHEEVVKQLLEFPGTQVDIANHHGWTALSLASRESPKTTELVKLGTFPGIEVAEISLDLEGGAFVEVSSYHDDALLHLKRSFPGIRICTIDNDVNRLQLTLTEGDFRIAEMLRSHAQG